MQTSRGLDVKLVLDGLEEVYGRVRAIPRFDPVEELICCIMSQHSADANSFPAFTRLRETYTTWDEVILAGQNQVANMIRAAGLANQKAKSIIATLQEIQARFGAITLEPLRKMSTENAFSWLVSLPGVGPKTASIVLSFNFGRPTIPIDTHVFRVSWRLGFIEKSIGETKAHSQIRKVVQDSDAFRFHALLIQHGRKICRAPTPLCPSCPVIGQCLFAAHA